LWRKERRFSACSQIKMTLIKDEKSKINHRQNTIKQNKKAIIVLGIMVISQFIFIYVGLAAEMTRRDLINCTNELRAEKKVDQLYFNERLNIAAEAKLADMQRYKYWAHSNPTTGKKPWDFVDEAGYYFKTTGENLAFGFMDSQKVCEAWKNSELHYANIINKTFQEVGFAIDKARLSDGNGILVVQMFGSRKDFIKPDDSKMIDNYSFSGDINDYTSQVKSTYYQKEESIWKSMTSSKDLVLLVMVLSYLGLRAFLIYNKKYPLSIRTTMLVSIFFALTSISIVLLYLY
jgi:hypothetical protein